MCRHWRGADAESEMQYEILIQRVEVDFVIVVVLLIYTTEDTREKGPL